MKTVSYSALREDLASTMTRVCEDCEPVIITRQKHEPVVMISLDEFESMQETAYLLRSPANAERLNEAITQLESGSGIERDLPEIV